MSTQNHFLKEKYLNYKFVKCFENIDFIKHFYYLPIVILSRKVQFQYLRNSLTWFSKTPRWHSSVSGQMYFGLCMARLWDIMTNYISWSAIGG